MHLAFVLVEPKVPENIGAAARALKTMGFAQLWIVNSDAHRQPEARWVAHGSDDILDAVDYFPDLPAVRHRADMLIGTSAKARHGRRALHSPQQLHKILTNKPGSLNQVALVFGREDRGLSNEELALCDLVTGIPLAVTYPSLNLGQAVMLYAYELSGLGSGAVPNPSVDTAAWRALRERVEALLPTLAMTSDSKLAQWLMERLPMIAEEDVGFLHTLCHNLETRLAQTVPLDRERPPTD